MSDELQTCREKLAFENALAQQARDEETKRVHAERAAGYAKRIDFLLHNRED